MILELHGVYMPDAACRGRRQRRQPLIGQHSVPERMRPVSPRLGRTVACKLCVSKKGDRDCRRPCFIGPSFFPPTPVDDTRRPAGEHHEHSGRLQSALRREAMFCQFLSGLRKPQGAHHQHQRGSAEGGCVALLQASTCAARLWVQPLE